MAELNLRHMADIRSPNSRNEVLEKGESSWGGGGYVDLLVSSYQPKVDK